MALFTIVIEDETEDIAIEQIVALTPKDAVIKCVSELDIDEYPGVGKKTKEALIKAIVDEANSCVKVRERKNLWCTSALAKGKLFIFNIIKTAQ
jgi:hypothetical protein